MNRSAPGGPVTVLFVDPMGSPTVDAAESGLGVEEELRFAAAVVASCAEDHGAHEVLQRGTGHMVIFRSPRRAIYCSVAVQRRIERHKRQRGQENETRIGINTGELYGDPAAPGSPGETAALIATKAKRGQILAASVVKQLAGPGGGTAFRDRGRLRLQGIPGRFQLYEVVWKTEDLPPVPLLPVERTPFVGRTSERTQALRIVDEAVRGRGSVLLIGGEAGVGKTRFASEVADEARRQTMIPLVGRCSETEPWMVPYLPVLQILEATRTMLPEADFRRILGDEAGRVARIMPEIRQLYPGVPEPAPLLPEHEHRHLLGSVWAVLQRAAEMQPLLLFVDDLQWADESSLLLLMHLAENIHDIPVLILGTYRDDELYLSQPLTNTLKELVRRRLAHRIVLKSLSRGEVGAMLENMAGHHPGDIADMIFSVTEGHPFFVEEVVKHLLETDKLVEDQRGWRFGLDVAGLEVPESVRLVIDSRLERLGDAGRRILTIAAAIGRDFSMELLRELSALDPGDLTDRIGAAERAHIIVPCLSNGRATFTFAHELIRHTLMESTSLPELQEIHASIARAMERVFADALDDHAVALAQHLYLAGAAADQRKVRHYLTLAGDKALAMTAFGDALRHYQSAQLLREPMEPARRSYLKNNEGLAYRSLGDLDRAIACWREALNAYEEMGAVEEAGSLCREMALQLSWSGRLIEAWQMAERGIAALGDRASPSRGRLQCMIARLLSGGGRYQEAATMIRESLDLAASLGDRRLLIDGLVAQSQHHYFYAEFDQAVEAGHRAAELLREIGSQWELAEILGTTESSLWQLGRSGEADRISKELQPVASTYGNAGALALALRLESFRTLSHTADLGAMERFAVDDMERCKRGAGLLLPQSYLYLGKTRFFQGRWEEALAQFQEGHRIAPKSVLAGFNWGGLFLHQCYLGNRDVALAMFEESRDELPQAGRTSGWGAITMALAAVEGLSVIGEDEKAAELYPTVLEIVRSGLVFRFDRRLAEIVAGMGAAAAQRWDDAETHYRKALAQAENLPQRFEQPEARRFYADMLIARNQPGDRDRAAELLREAIRDYRAIGMPRHEQLAKASLTRAKPRASASRSAEPGSTAGATAVSGPPTTAQTAHVPHAPNGPEASNLFLKEADYWTIVHEGRTSRIRDSAGLRYLAWLLRNPGKDFHVFDMVLEVQGRSAPNGMSSSKLDDLGLRPQSDESEEILDPRAVAAFRQRINDLLEDLKEAEGWNDAERASQIRKEIEALTQELARGRGFAGHARRATTTAERARVSVTKAIKGAIRKIAEDQPVLGRHLHNAVRTGQFCSYTPDPTSTIDWQF